MFKSNMELLEGGSGTVSLPKKLIWNQLVLTKVGIFCLGVMVGKDYNHELTQEEGFFFGKQMCFCKEDEESLEHFLLHCLKVWYV